MDLWTIALVTLGGAALIAVGMLGLVAVALYEHGRKDWTQDE